MESLTEQIAGISLFAVLVLLSLLTAVRALFFWGSARAAVLRAAGELTESVILAVVIVFLLLRPFVVQSYFIPSGSMHPTLWEGDHILVDKCVYRFHPPQRGDIIVFRAPKEAAPDEKEFIKRLIGLPGDVVSVESGYVTVGLTTYTSDRIRTFLGGIPTGMGALGDPTPLRMTRDGIFMGDQCIAPDEFAQAVGKPGQRVYIHPGRVLVDGRMLIESYTAEDPQYDMPACRVPSGDYFVMGDNRNNSDDSHVWGTLPQDRVIGRADVVFWPMSRLRWLK